MSDKASTPAADSAAGASSSASSTNAGTSSNGAPKKPLPQQNPAFRAMGLPRLRLPSRNWMIFLSITGSFAGAVIYDKWQTKRMREKWCNMVSHIAEEPLDTKVAPRKITIYLSAPPGDGLRNAREHFHNYVKPVLVAAAMDWDVVEGRKEGDVRHKTSEKIRKRRKRNGEGLPQAQKDEEEYTVESLREKNGYVEYPGVAGDLVIGRNTWKEYIRGLHEGYLGSADPPKELENDQSPETPTSAHTPGHSSMGDAAVKAATNIVGQDSVDSPTPSEGTPGDDASPATEESLADAATEAPAEEVKKEEEKPKRRFPAPYILPEDYETATLSRSTPEIIGPSVGIRMPHLLGIRNTPIRIYRFLTRRRLQDDVGRQVASAILASHRPYGSVGAVDEDSASDSTVEVPEQKTVLDFEEKDWWKTIHEPRKEHEESVWIEPMKLDERIISRMRAFELTSEDEAIAKRIEAGQETKRNED
ncbi:hypothetical protein M409DRAFT_69618 [Zasmidium cellare ATCC 36951]|uniref:Mitochondrial import inner membrane translocase subunit TIM54 n=1 Tax=Zasmidium cellare ATCC 36951 TaxID=1080233 RepID=A0A6A6C3Y4_ZASCE|nr:uncharacterized protein M409DRAFT_69618 [Zasmidium cellare ATCC 36951]KAF2161824.1 hypothetical protein M409DRAFT_69618 [Zasmidium cellare ATCC 36951]